MHTTPETLLQRLRQPADRQAWGRFVALYSPLLLHWAAKVGLQDQDALDLVQDVFLILLRKLPDFEYDPGQGFRRWLKTVILNKFRDRARQRQLQPGQATPGELNDLAQPETDGVFAEVEYRRHLLHQALGLVRGEFQPTTWKAFLEHGLAGRPAAAVAAELGLREGAVYAAKFRVLGRLRTELGGLMD